MGAVEFMRFGDAKCIEVRRRGVEGPTHRVMLTTWPVIELSEIPSSFSSTGFRPRASMMDSLTAVFPNPGPVPPEQLPAAWLTTRRLRASDATGSLTFFDLEYAVTHGFVTVGRHPSSIPRVTGRNWLPNRQNVPMVTTLITGGSGAPGLPAINKPGSCCCAQKLDEDVVVPR